MSRDTNIIVISGRLTRDPELKYTKESKSVCSFSIACNDSDEKVNFFDCQAWEKLAEIVNQYCKKGKKILVNGRINQQRWEDSEGKPRQKNIINVQQLEFMSTSAESQSSIPEPKEQTQVDSKNPMSDEDIPF